MCTKYLYTLAFSVALIPATQAHADGHENTCTALVGPISENALIDRAELVEASDAEPAHCLVHGHVETKDPRGANKVGFKAWLPADWNGKMHMQGGSGFVAALDAISAGPALARGYAQIYTDTGHQAESPIDARWAKDNLPALVDFGYRGVHVAALAGKELIAKYYDQAPAYSYFEGCSRGGGQALMEAQRYPDDFDGIIAAAPAINWTAFISQFASNQQALYPNGPQADPAFPAQKIALLEQSIDTTCDATDGIEDNLISTPSACSIELEDLATCEEGEDCLIEAELSAMSAVYEDVTYSGGTLIEGFPVGNEADELSRMRWQIGQPDAFGPGYPNLQYAFADQFIQNIAPQVSTDGKLSGFDIERYSQMDAIGQLLNADNPNLSGFAGRNGKLIMWHGWADAALSADTTISYYDQISGGHGITRDSFARLFMVPGMQHCRGGEGPNQFDMLTALENWVEKDSAPDQIAVHSSASDAAPAVSRILCPYPKTAELADPSANPDQSESFVCR